MAKFSEILLRETPESETLTTENTPERNIHDIPPARTNVSHPRAWATHQRLPARLSAECSHATPYTSDLQKAVAQLPQKTFVREGV